MIPSTPGLRVCNGGPSGLAFIQRPEQEDLWATSSHVPPDRTSKPH